MIKFIDLVRQRHSVRAYEADRVVEPEKLAYIKECVRLAPSAVNFQPWKFITVADAEGKRKLCQCYDREWFATAPMYVIACADHSQSWHRGNDGKDHADIDISIAVEHLCLAAAEQNLGTCWVCNFDAQLCRQLFALPENIEPCVLVPVGYAVENVANEKKRKDVAEIWP